MPAEIGGIGSTQQKLRVAPDFDPLKAKVGPEEYFLLSRIDGTQTLRELLLATGLPVDRGVAIVARLRSIGALLLPGETSASGTGPVEMAPAPAPPAPDILPNPTAEEKRALAEVGGISVETRRKVLALARLAAEATPDSWALLGVPEGTAQPELKRAYFRLAKEIHPDRFYGKQLGSFGPRLSTVFEAVSRAYQKLLSGS